MNMNAALREKLPENEYALFFEVRDAAGFESRRSADAVSVCLWPSRGLEVIGYEMKSARGDWLRELKNPEKAEAIFKFCDRWVLLTTPGVAKLEEIPVSWGWWELNDKGKFVGKVAPAKLEPAPLSRSFVAALLKRAGQVDARLVKAEVVKQRQGEAEEFQRRVDAAVAREMRAAKELRAQVDKFKEASGIEIGVHTWNVGEIGKAVKLILEMENATQAIDHVKRVRDTLSTMLEHA